MRRFWIIAAECCIAVVAGTALLAGVFFWRLTAGPVTLDFLSPYIEAALSDFDENTSVRVDESLLIWDGTRREVQIRVQRVVARDAEGALVASLPDVDLGLNLQALVQGTIAPTYIEVTGPRINLVRQLDGSFAFGSADFSRTGNGAGQGRSDGDEPTAEPGRDDNAAGADNGIEGPLAPPEDGSRALRSALAELLTEPGSDKPLAYLQEVRIQDSSIRLEDRRSGSFWFAPDANVSLRRDRAGLAGELDLILLTDGERSTLNGAFVYEKASNAVDLAISVDNLAPSSFASLAPEAGAFAGFSAPLSANMSASIGLDGDVSFLRFELSGRPGVLAADGLLVQPLPVRGILIKGSFDGIARHLEIEQGSIQLGGADASGPEITFAGQMDTREGVFEISGEASVTDVPMDDLERYWPLNVSKGGRDWVLENVRAGLVEVARVELAVSLPQDDPEALSVETVKGELTYRDLDVHFLRPMPPITDISGRADFDASQMRFETRSGRLGSLQLKPGTVTITGFDRDGPEILSIRTAVVGPVRDALELLNHDRLKLIEPLGIDPADTSGMAETDLTFDFPLLAALTFDDIDLTANARLSDTGIRGALFGQDATNGQLTMELDQKEMRITGPVELGGVAGTIDWFEPFDSGLPTGTVLKADVPFIDNAGRERLGFDFAPYLDGPVSASLVYTKRRDLPDQVETAANLEAAKLDVAALKWSKPVGVPGDIRATVELVDERATRISNVMLNAGDLTAAGNVTMDPTGREIAEIVLSSLRFGRTAVTDVYLQQLPEETNVSIGGGTIDAAPYLADEPVQGSEAGDGKTAAGEERDAFSVTTRNLDSLLFGDDRYLENVTLSLQQSRIGWERIFLDGRIPKRFWTVASAEQQSAEVTATPPDTQGSTATDASPAPVTDKTVSLDFRPVTERKQSLRAKTNDLGAMMRILDVSDAIRGGFLEVRGESDGPSPAFPIKATLQARDYRLVNAPVLAKVLTFGSLTGARDTLAGEGIVFSRLIGDFTVDNGVASSEMMRAYGAALGITAKGQIDFDGDEIEIEGTVVPAYTVNRILGRIPLLGTILTGGEGGGVLGVTYTVRGPVEEPDVSVNALSALAPGFLRGLFTGEGEPAVYPDEREEP